MIRVAIVGCGTMGGLHAKCYESIKNAEVVGVCDKDADKSAELGGDLGVPAFGSLSELLSNIECDAVDICSTTDSHYDMIRTAAKAQKHICCEKPLARTTTDAEDAILDCQTAQVRLFVAHSLRWSPAFSKINELVKAGSVGEPVMVKMFRGGPFPVNGKWVSELKKSGGIAFDLLVHDYDFLSWTFGKIKSVFARGLLRSNIPEKDYALVTVKFESGLIAQIEGDWTQTDGQKTAIEIEGTKGALGFSVDAPEPTHISGRLANGTTGEVEIDNSQDAYQSELEHFIECLDTGKDFNVSPVDAIEAVRVGEAAVKSITGSRPVKI